MVGHRNLVWDTQSMIGVVVASKGYPEEYEKGAVLKGLADFSQDSIIPSMQEQIKIN